MSDSVKLMVSHAENDPTGRENDTECLSSIPGMVESIKEAEKYHSFISGEDLEW